MRIRLLALGLTVALAAPSFAQTPSARAQTLAGEFSKLKNETRVKKGATRTKYKEVVSAAWVTAPSAYAGHYVTEDPSYLDITIDTNGRATGAGRDHARFELRHLIIAGGLLTGTKAYVDGRSEKFEAVFLKRSTRDAANADFFSQFGIGVLAEEFRIFAVKQ
jgi:hypothetical protein